MSRGQVLLTRRLARSRHQKGCAVTVYKDIVVLVCDEEKSETAAEPTPEELVQIAEAAKTRGHDCVIVKNGSAGVLEVVLWSELAAEVGDIVELEHDGLPPIGRVVMKHNGVYLVRCEESTAR